MQDVLLTVPDLCFCYEVAKKGSTTGLDYTLATRNLHVVGRFNNPNSPAPPPSRQSSFRIESCRKMFFGSLARSCGGGAASILLLKYRRTLRLHLGVSGTTVGAKLQERQVAATATCDVDHFQETSTCMTSARSMYVVWSSRIAEYGSTG